MDRNTNMNVQSESTGISMVGGFRVYNRPPPRDPKRPDKDLSTIECAHEEVATRLDESIVEFRRAVSRGGTLKDELAALQKIREIREWILGAGERLTIHCPQGSCVSPGHNEIAESHAKAEMDAWLVEEGIDPNSPIFDKYGFPKRHDSLPRRGIDFGQAVKW
jgi:hypothetical protein